MDDEQGSDAQMTDEQRQRIAHQLAGEQLAGDLEEQITAAQPDTGRDGARYAH